MRKCVFWLLLSLVAVPQAGCTPSSDPVPVEPPAQPLVIGTTPPMPIATAAEAPLPAPEDDTPNAPMSTVAVDRDPRIVPSRQRAVSLVVTEVQQLEALFTATASGAPDRPSVMRRLAEDYSELSRSADPRTSTTAHARALKYYEMLANEYPTYARIDEVWYYAGLEHELAGDFANARRAYYNLIKTSPQSKLIPLAYFAFGEMFNAEAASDPSKEDLALQAYREVLKYPPPQNHVYAHAERRAFAIKARKLKNGAGAAGVTPP